MMSRAYAALSDLDFSYDDSSSSEEDKKVKRKPGDFTGLSLMGKSSWHISDSDVSDDLSPDGLSLRVVELENVICSQDKLLCKVFHENKKLNLELQNAFSDVASLRSTDDDMSIKPCEKCTMIIVSYADLWLMHFYVACLVDGARLELRELKARSLLMGACTSCPLLRSDLEVAAVEIKDLKYKLLATLFYPIHVKHVSLSREAFPYYQREHWATVGGCLFNCVSWENHSERENDWGWFELG
jgi:hypothetical protein